MKGNKIIKITLRELKRIISDSIKELLSEQSKKVIDFDLKKYFNSIPINDLRQQYYDLNIFKNVGGFGDRFMLTDEGILKEENSTTLSPDETKSTLCKQFGFKDWQIQEVKGSNGITLMALFPKLGENKELIVDAMAACGWSIGTSQIIEKNDMLWNAMTFEPMQQDMISDTIRFQHRYLYHWTPLANYQNIMANGLEPRSENDIFHYSPRVHFLTDITNIIKVLSIGDMLYSAGKNHPNNGKYILLSIDLLKVPNLKLYYDPRLEGGVYAKETVPSSAISPVIGFDFANKSPFSL